MTPCPARCEPKTEPAARHRAGATDERCVEDFARALRDKDDAQAMPTGCEATACATVAPLAAPPPAAKAPTLCAPQMGPRSQTGIDAPACLAQLDLSTISTPGSDAARAFEVSVNEPMGVSITLHAVQPVAATAPGITARWTLSIASSSLNLTVLKHHSGRLDARLRSRALSNEPVRIENDDHE
jgi:hypothetical protein